MSFQYNHLVTLCIFIQVVGIVFVFLFYYDQSILISLKIYPDQAFNDAILRYRDDPDQQDFIDGWQKDVRTHKQRSIYRSLCNQHSCSNWSPLSLTSFRIIDVVRGLLLIFNVWTAEVKDC